jgi:hypothetical protein
MVGHYLFDAEFCIRLPAGKGAIEKNVQDERHRLWLPGADCRHRGR